jgi:L-threonylcarbamoyladenylate synthase
MKINIKKIYPNAWSFAKEIIENDGVVVLPTDTLYGIVGKAESKKAVAKIYKIKARDKNKPFIVLITSYKDLDIFDIKVEKWQEKFLQKFWPGKVSVILSCPLNKWRYLHRGTKSIAFRMISSRNKNLYNLINKVGPLVAPSANTEGGKPAETIKEVQNYFYPVRNREGSQRLPISNGVGNGISLYINGGKRNTKPSTLVRLEDNNWIILRQGAKEIK